MIPLDALMMAQSFYILHLPVPLRPLPACTLFNNINKRQV